MSAMVLKITISVTCCTWSFLRIDIASDKLCFEISVLSVSVKLKKMRIARKIIFYFSLRKVLVENVIERVFILRHENASYQKAPCAACDQFCFFNGRFTS
jgi:hypothetical protein